MSVSTVGKKCIRRDALLGGRYAFIESCSEGSYCSAARCWDTVSKQHVVLKIMKPGVKSKRAQVQAIKREMRLLRDVDEHSRRTQVVSGCVRVYDAFQDKGSVFLVMESLGTSYVEILRNNDYRPLPLIYVKSVMRQALHSIAFLHNMGMIHLDVKPHNILAADNTLLTGPVECCDGKTRIMSLPSTTAVRLIDFGGSRYETEHDAGYNYTTEFRSPEVILDLEITTATDMWSFATVLIQLYTGQLLFGRITDERLSNLQHFASMAQVLGAPYPRHLAVAALDESDYALDVFSDTGDLLHCPAATEGRVWTLEERLAPFDSSLADLLRHCLQYNPAHRITAAEALNHPFFAEKPSVCLPKAAAVSSGVTTPRKLGEMGLECRGVVPTRPVEVFPPI